MAITQLSAHIAGGSQWRLHDWNCLLFTLLLIAVTGLVAINSVQALAFFVNFWQVECPRGGDIYSLGVRLENLAEHYVVNMWSEDVGISDPSAADNGAVSVIHALPQFWRDRDRLASFAVRNRFTELWIGFRHYSRKE